MSGPIVDLSFPHAWQAEILPRRPAILPVQHYVYPREVEEIERGALEVLVRAYEPERRHGCADLAERHEPGHDLPGSPAIGPRRWGGLSCAENVGKTEIGALAPAREGTGFSPYGSEAKDQGTFAPAREGTGFSPYGNEAKDQGTFAPAREGTGFSPYGNEAKDQGALAPEANAESLILPPPFLATCAVGFLDPVVPTGIWSCPDPREICAVSGGYAYLIDTSAPERFTMIAVRPVLEVRPAVEAGLLLFVGHHSILAWGKEGQAWQSEKLSDEGVTITGIESGMLRGIGWKMMTDKEAPFAIDLQTGMRLK